MRTRLNIDDDLAREIKLAAYKSGTPVGTIVNTALRRGLERMQSQRPRKRYVCPAFDLGRPAVNLDKALALTTVLEGDEIFRKFDLRK